MKIKISTSILILISCIFAYADTPLTQALKVQRQLNDVKAAIQSRGVECPNLESMSNAVMQINDINQFMSGTYSGKIQMDAETVSWYAFKNVPGNYRIYAPNLISMCEAAYRYANGLTEFYAPECLAVPMYAFSDCPSLRCVSIPKCNSMSSQAFINDQSLTDVDISQIAGIPESTFQNCYNLKNVKSKPLTSVSRYAFQNCHNLTNVTFAEYFGCGECAFQNCYALKVKLPKNLNYANHMFENCRSLDEIDLSEEDATRLTYNYIFYGCTGVTNLNLGPVKELCGDSMFRNLGITVFSNDVLECIGKSDDDSYATFAENKKLKSLHLSKLQSITRNYGYGSSASDKGVFEGCTKLEDIYMPELYVIGQMKNNTANNDQYISSQVFANCTSLKSISLPKLQELHGCKMFYNCTSLTNISMPSLKIWSNGEVGDWAYGLAHCKSLKRIHLPNLVQISYGCKMFYNCYNLEEVVFPKLWVIFYDYNVSINMENMFMYCEKLKNVTFGMPAAGLIGIYKFPGGAPLTTVFHCMGDAPYNTDIVYKNGSWQIMTNGTYKLVDYIKSTGTQYLNSGVIFNTNTVVELDCWLGTGSNQYEELFGSSVQYWDIQDMHACYRFKHEQKFSFARSGTEQTGSAYDDGNYHIVASNTFMDIYKVYDDNTLELFQRLTVPGNTDEGASPIGIFVCNTSRNKDGFTASAYPATNMKLYRAKIYKDGILQCDLVPALANDNIPCAVDLANNYHPHFNYGTGEFEYGSVTNENIIVNQK